MSGSIDSARRGRRLAAPACLAATLILGGCATAPSMTTPALSWAERRAVLQNAGEFALTGRVAVNAGGEGFNASMRWQQQGDLSLVSLDGPLGVGGARIETDGTQLSLTTSRGESMQGEEARAEIEKRIGFPLPLDSLRYWVRGVPAPASEASENLDATAQRLAGLEQNGWRIAYDDYTNRGVTNDELRELPRLLTAERAGTRVRVVIDRWE